MSDDDELVWFGNEEHGPLAHLLAWPGDFFRKSILPKLRGKEYPYYHRKYPRVATVDQCNSDDVLCVYEANMQYQRDLRVDNAILEILRDRKAECYYHWMPDHEFKCCKERDDLYVAERNWQIKHGDQGVNATALNAFYKQKHRMVFERRHGPIGCGKKPPSQWAKKWEPTMHSKNFKGERADLDDGKKGPWFF